MLQLKDGPLKLCCFVKHRADVLKQTCTILKGFLSTMHALLRVQDYLNSLQVFNAASVQNLDEVMLSTFSENGSLKEESNSRFQNPFSNAAVERTIKPDRD